MPIQRVFNAMSAVLDSGFVESRAPTVNGAQEGTGSKSAFTTHLQAGQEDVAGSDLAVYQGVFKFDTSSIPDSASITSALLELYVLDIQATVAWTLGVFDWGSFSEVDTIDFTSKTTLVGMTRRAFDNMIAGDPEGLYIAMANEASFIGNINKLGLTPFLLASSRQVNGNDFTGQIEYATFADGDSGTPPKLTISYNTVPDAPIHGARANFDATQAALFPFTHSDPDIPYGDSQTAYQLRIYRVSNGALAYDSGKVISAAVSHNVPGATLTNGLQYQWQVRTWDEDDAVGAYSSLQSFYTSAPPTATIIAPAAAEVVASSSYSLIWGFSDPEGESQLAYRVVLTRVSDSVVVLDTGKVLSSVNTIQLTGMANGQQYTVQVYLWDAKDVSSAVASRTFTVTYAQPSQPIVTLDDEGHFIQVFISNPAPTGGDVVAAKNDVLRRVQGETAWTRLAKDLGVNVVYVDYTVAHGVIYEYKVTAYSGAGGTRDSTVVNESISLTLTTWIHVPTDPVGTSIGFNQQTLERSEETELDVHFLNFAGRTKPVAEFGDATSREISFTIFTLSLIEVSALHLMFLRKTTLCYRDNYGRKMFGVISEWPVDDPDRGQKVSVTITETDYPEEV